MSEYGMNEFQVDSIPAGATILRSELDGLEWVIEYQLANGDLVNTRIGVGKIKKTIVSISPDFKFTIDVDPPQPLLNPKGFER